MSQSCCAWIAATLLAACTVAAWAEDVPPAAGAEPAAERPVAEEKLAPLATVARSRGDRMDLESSSIRGNQELPKVLYIVPWKDPNLGELVGKPVNSLVDEVIAPVDREVFLRQTMYFDQLYTDPDADSE